jgi:diguanylate cyclase (GGDEF)-like protein
MDRRHAVQDVAVEHLMEGVGARPRILDLRATRPLGQPLGGHEVQPPLSIPTSREPDAGQRSAPGALTRWWDGPDVAARGLPLPTRVLLVDDDSMDAELVRIALAEVAGKDCALTTVIRLAEARDKVTFGSYDCVLLDLSLPDSGGLDTIAGIVSVAPDMPIVVLTGLDDELTAIAAVQAGAQDYLIKRSLDGPVLWRTVRYAIERKRAEVVARHNTLHDRLTGLPNRVRFIDRLTLAMTQPEREVGHVAVMFIDIDRFKWVNDSLGHAAGDALLIAVARRLEDSLRPRDVAARLGGDEFLVMCENMPSEFAAFERAERIRAALGAPFQIGETEIWISASIGIAFSNDPVASPKDVIRDADRAMYRAKDRGKARSELFDVEMRDRAENRWRMANDLHRALDAGEFSVDFQPVVELASRQPVGAEALVRWQHPDGRLVPPAEFIPLAEETGLVVPIGDVVLDAACRRLARWQAERRGVPGLVVTVNVSPRQLEDAGFPGRVCAALERSGVDPTGLGLEVTETALMRDEKGSLERLLEVESLGVKLYLDDFGTGYSSLTYLKRFPFHALKIDTSFTKGLGVDEQDTAIVEAVIGLARSLRLTVVAEGVETAEQAERLTLLGCQFGQGYYFARPTADGRLTPTSRLE